MTVAVFGHNAGVKVAVTRGDNDCADVFFNDLVFLAEVNGFQRTASLNAFETMDAGIQINVIDQGYGLTHRDISCLTRSQIHLEIIGNLNGAGQSTRSAAVTTVSQHMLRLLPEGDFEISDEAFNLLNFGVGPHIN